LTTVCGVLVVISVSEPSRVNVAEPDTTFSSAGAAAASAGTPSAIANARTFAE
jgi:hypothetical protein